MRTHKKNHAIATQLFRTNYIATLMGTDNIAVHDHDQKAAILWNSFKNRIGKAETTAMQFNIDHLARTNSLEDLEKPFTREEINAVIKNMPNDRSPGPDGFNGIFM